MAEQQVDIKVRLEAAQKTIDILENLRNLSKGSEKNAIELLEKEAQLVKSSLESPESLSPELLKESDKILKGIIAKTQKWNVRISELPKDSKIKIEEWQKQIEKSSEELISKDSALSKLTRKFQQKEDGSFEPGKTGKFYREEVRPELFEKAEKEGIKFESPISGNEIKDMKRYAQEVEEVESLFDSKNKIQQEILKKLQDGQKLTAKEEIVLNKVLSKNKDIEKNREIAIKMMKNKNKIHQLEQKIIEDKYKNDSTIKDLEKGIKLQEKNIQLNKKLIDQELEKYGGNVTKRQIDDNNELNKISNELTENTRKEINAKKENKKATEGLNNTQKKTNTTFGQAAKQVFNYGIAFNALRRIYRETIRTITELDKAFTEMAIVTTMSREEAWALSDQMFDLARQTGFTATEIAKLSTVYFRQGRTLSEVIELTRVAAMAARVAGISAQESANFLTSAVNAFRLSADEALAVSDRFAALAASSASSYQELAVGLSKFAAQANVAGIGIDFAMGMLAKGVETTREAPETIGTAIKSVTARMRELTDLGKTFEDGMDINRVETALRQVGVALRDEYGQFRNLENVLTDVGMKWDTLNKNQQASVAVALAGIRQQSRLIAIMNDFERTQELVEISQESAGATAAQHVEFMNSLEAATVRMQNAYQEFIKTITESEIIIGIVNSIASVIETFSDGLKSLGLAGKNAMIAIIGIGVALKVASVSVAIFSKLAVAAGLSTKAWTVSMIAGKIATLGLTGSLKALTAVLLANPITLIITAITAAAVGLVFAVGRMTTSAERAEKEFKKLSKTLTAGRYEIAKTERSFKDLNEEIEKYNNMPFLTAEQSEELNTSLEKLAELVGEENVVRVNGVIDLELSEDLIEEFSKEQAKKLEDNINKTFDETFKRVRERTEIAYGGVVETLSGGRRREFLGSFLEEEEGLTAQEIANFSDSLIYQYEKMFGELDSEQEKLARMLVDSTDFSKVDFRTASPEEFLERNFRGAFDQVIQFEELFEDTGSIKEKVQSYNESLLGITDEKTLNLIKDQFSDLEFILKEGFDLDLLESLGLNNTEDIQRFSRIFGGQTLSVLDSIEKRAKDISNSTGLSLENAIKVAWTELAETTEDAEESAFFYSQAIEKTSLEVAQGLDTVINRLKNINEQQQKIIEGTATAEEIYNFVENNADLFESMDDVTAFLSGQSIDSKVFASRIKEEENAVLNLQNSISILNNEFSTTEQKQDAIKQIAMASALLQYNGTLKQVTESQYRYNESLESYETLTNLGIDTTALSQRILQDQLHIIDKAGESIVDQVNKTKQSFNDLKQELEDSGVEQTLEGNFEDFISFDEVSKRFIPLYDSLDGLSRTTIDSLVSYTEELNTTIDGSLEIFQEARDMALQLEKEKIDAQRQAYQDYYDALDRMESQRETAQTREEIVEQLSRLQGATDEASRQKALSLQQELNNLNEKNAKDIISQNRQDTLEALDQKYEEAEARWTEAGAAFISEFSGAIENGSTEFSDSVVNDLAEHSGLNDLPTNLEITFSTFLDNFEEILGNVDATNSLDINDFLEKEEWIQNRIKQLMQNPQSFVTAGKDALAAMQMVAENEAKEIFGFSKGGMANFTGPAMLHGSKTNPEAVLNPEQTKMFLGLRNALENFSINSNTTNSSISIDNISISTGSLNTNQDFASAGETLAKAFRQAVQRKGITLNTKR